MIRALAACAVILLLLRAPAAADGAQLKHVQLTKNGEPELCGALLEDLKRELPLPGSFCGMPDHDIAPAITVPRWQPVSVDENLPLLTDVVPMFSWDTSILVGKIAKDVRDFGPRQKAEFWDRYGKGILGAMHSPGYRFERAMIRWSSAESPHPVYRMSVIGPASQTDPTGQWLVHSCDSKADFHGLFIAKGAWHAPDDLDASTGMSLAICSPTAERLTASVASLRA